ncbi:MAG: glycosyltransferase [Bryobacterales bacterium]|nr:glycosyltransferase [Bryobacterales bacterium]
MRLSILVPVYNERTVVERSLRQVVEAPLPASVDREVILVDDCSTDGTAAILERLAASDDRFRLVRHGINQGKGAAVRTAIEHASGDFCLVQDADLEYDPAEYPRLLGPLIDGHADAVFGSRYMAGGQRRILPFWHTQINSFLTAVSNMFSNLDLTDMETCYKAFRTDILKSIPIRSNRFGFEPEIVMKCAKRGLRIYEVPISYHGRTYEEGKKIGWKDGVKALGVILRFWLIDDLYAESYGRKYIANLSGTPQYLAWVAHLLRPHLGDRVLELGAGLGNFTARLMARRVSYVCSEQDRLYLHALSNRFLRTPNVTVRQLRPDQPSDFEGLQGEFDTVLSVNVLEYMEDPSAVIGRLAACLRPGGRLVILVPCGLRRYGSLDRALGVKQRFDHGHLAQMIRQHGLVLVQAHQLNRMGALAWWVFGKLLHREHLNKVSLKLFDKSVWIWRRIDRIFPWRGLSLIIVAGKGETGESSEIA